MGNKCIQLMIYVNKFALELYADSVLQQLVGVRKGSACLNNHASFLPSLTCSFMHHDLRQ
jgi:hypothetical protein